MKFLIISDTHGRLHHAESVIERLEGVVSAVIHLGDMYSDAKVLEAEYDGLEFHCVAGNCDYYYSVEDGMEPSKIIEYGGVSIFLTHGHEDGVKRGYSRLAARAKKSGASVALCGHTHTPFNDVVDGVLCVNPGSISFPRRNATRPTYAVLNITGDSPPVAGIVEMRV